MPEHERGATAQPDARATERVDVGRDKLSAAIEAARALGDRGVRATKDGPIIASAEPHPDVPPGIVEFVPRHRRRS